MKEKRKIEVFTAGCPFCDDAVQIVRDLACESCEIIVHDLTDGKASEASLEKAEAYGIKQVPAVVVDGTLASCCASGGVDRDVLTGLGIGSPV